MSLADRFFGPTAPTWWEAALFVLLTGLLGTVISYPVATAGGVVVAVGVLFIDRWRRT